MNLAYMYKYIYTGESITVMESYSLINITTSYSHIAITIYIYSNAQTTHRSQKDAPTDCIADLTPVQAGASMDAS